ncbi:polysaccharide pyruvyl transferase [Rhodanobacter thiooxydans]|uniref:Polysaccharide pyruvyl transferase n=1 Tax=Rhodanobacter thiooxydans TaxID=416169 RepID=A0A154QCX9_9GAMM|nr:polysaccharide pyruvyl transferase family protein [Rhodanobacter thiooxydans]EIM02191.1 succinoglycan biosynthesis ketolase [Rhodanobacter thiooxydans LCS2]KZC22036.1 polysaccharide pyruvyl transferase [Rhodanobacter thiooxydans]MCW0200503.1 polysaccharide pyruvyl transferase family protein [Rhodanobacter thiooxydans]
MKLYYYIDRRGNFGDDLNPWLWPKLIPNVINDDDSEIFVGIGTLLNNNIPEGPNKIVFGSGAGYGSALPTVDEKWKFYCVRGPLTAARLGLPGEYAVTDPAALVSTVFRADDSKRSGIAFIPHHLSAWNLDWERVCRDVGIRYIDPRKDVDTVLGEIARSSAIIAEAMHGAILADSFRIPWMPVVLYDHILQPKWLDWAGSLALKYSPVRLNGAWDPDYNYSKLDQLKIVTKRSLCKIGLGSTTWTPPPAKSTNREIESFVRQFERMVREPSLMLSKDSVFDEASSRLMDKLEQFKADFS